MDGMQTNAIPELNLKIPVENGLDQCLSAGSQSRLSTKSTAVPELESVCSEGLVTWSLPGCVPEEQAGEIHQQVTPQNRSMHPKVLIGSTPETVYSESPSRKRNRLGTSPSSKLRIPTIWPTSPSQASACSVDGWHDPNETLILFDWDDTLCPTSACYAAVVGGETHSGDRMQFLEQHQAAVIDLLRTARSVGGVAIVTMATQAWVQQGIQALMPEVNGALQELKIEVVGARTDVSKHFLRESMGEAREPAHFLKKKAMTRTIKKFYREPNFLRRAMSGATRSWKNIISIGDSQAERLALQDIIFQHCQRDRNGRCKECRCKTLLLMEEPTVEELTRQLRALQEGLPMLVRHDGDLDLDISECDEVVEALLDI